MRKQIFCGAAVMLLMCITLVWATQATERLTEKQLSLSDIKALYVFIQGVTDETKKVGLSAERIQAEIEEKLKGIGVEVVSEEEAERLAGSASIYVNISAHKRERVAAFMFHVNVGIIQKVSLVRDPTIEIMSITWTNGRIGECHSRKLVKAMQETVGYLMDRFCKDYRKANPPIKVEG